MKFYTLTAYLDQIEVGACTVRQDETIDDLTRIVDKEFGPDNWNRFEISAYSLSA